MIHMRQMTDRDLPRGMELKDQAGWNQTQADWRRLMELEPPGCFVAELEDRVVGTVAAAAFRPVGWIAMVLVDTAVRGRGIGMRLVEHAMAYLDECGVRTMRLDATPLGSPIYQRLGFEPQYELARWEGVACRGADVGWAKRERGPTEELARDRDAGGPALRLTHPTTQHAAHPCLRPVSPDEVQAAARLDDEATGSDRERLLRLLCRHSPHAMRAFVLDGVLVGYATFREGSRAWHLGPAIARTDEAGLALLEAVTHDCAGRPVYIDIPVENAAATGWAKSKGLVVQRRFTRMYRGPRPCDQPLWLWASSGPENG